MKRTPEEESPREQIARLERERDTERQRLAQIQTTLQGVLDRSNDEVQLKSAIQQALGFATGSFSETSNVKKQPPLTPPKPKHEIKTSDSPQFPQQLVASTGESSHADSKDVKAKRDTKQKMDVDPPLALALPRSFTCQEIIEEASTLEISPPPLSLAIPRMPGIAGTLFVKKGQNCILLPKWKSNPYLPSQPGHPGVLLADREELYTGKWSLFVPLPGRLVRLNYLGDYNCKSMGDLSASEFKELGSEVKEAWAGRLHTAIRNEPYRTIRARMTLRNKKLDPDDARNSPELQAETQRILTGGRKYKSALKIGEIIIALEKGQEHLRINKLQCVSYSHKLAQEYQRAAETTPVPSGPASSGSKKRKRSSTSLPQRKRQTSAGSARGSGSPKGKGKASAMREDSDSDSDVSLIETSSPPSTRRSQRSRKLPEKLRGQS